MMAEPENPVDLTVDEEERFLSLHPEERILKEVLFEAKNLQSY